MPEINGIPTKSKVLVFLEEYSMWRFAGNAVFLEEYSMWRSAGNAVFLEENSMWRFVGNAVFLEEYSMWRFAGNAVNLANPHQTSWSIGVFGWSPTPPVSVVKSGSKSTDPVSGYGEMLGN